MNKKEIFARYGLLILGLFVIAFGVSLITKSTLGAAPISTLAFVLSIFTPYSMGFYMLVVNGLLIIGQMLMLGRKGIYNFRKELLLQIPISILFAVFIDLSLYLQQGIAPTNYFWSLAILLLGAFFLALGIALEVIGNVAMNSAEYIVQVATRKFKKDFGVLKVINDIIMVLIAVVVTLILGKGSLQGVREGTIIVALLTGFIVRAITPYLAFLRHFIDSLGTPTSTPVSEGELTTYPIITIAREWGSGGNLVGEMLSQKLGIPVYDKEMINMAAQEIGLSEENVRKIDQQVPNLILFNMVQDYGVPIEKSLSRADQLFVAQCRVIHQLAAQGPCIIVGRLGDYVLQDNPQLLSVFLHADKAYKVRTVMDRTGLDHTAAEAKIQHINTARANHYWHYTDRKWEDASHYTLTLDTSTLGIIRVTDLIAQVYTTLSDTTITQ